MILSKAVKKYLNTLGWPGLLTVVKARTLKRVLLFQVVHPEIRFPFHLRIPSSDMFTYEQVYLKREYDFVAHESPRVIVDAGANIGLASLYFANRFPKARIIAIEAEATNYKNQNQRRSRAKIQSKTHYIHPTTFTRPSSPLISQCDQLAGLEIAKIPFPPGFLISPHFLVESGHPLG